ncbi:hypothetical protein [Haladaptatus sp. DJG-WS-42]|uniref:hypothetical protein n=1 Tax=Haladaptatus sp. DJG-WS-42 TaxID=3120516 RepID=UPI0030D2C46C
MANGDPIEGQVLLIAGAKASVPAHDLAPLVDRVQEQIGPKLDEFRDRFELVFETEAACFFFVGHEQWAVIAHRVDMNDREMNAVRRAHNEQLLRVGRREDRRFEFDAALDIRDCIVIGKAEA